MDCDAQLPLFGGEAILTKRKNIPGNFLGEEKSGGNVRELCQGKFARSG